MFHTDTYSIENLGVKADVKHEIVPGCEYIITNT